MSRAPSFVPINRAVAPKNLTGPLRIVAIVDKASMDRLKRGLGLALQAEAERTALSLARRGAELMERLDTGAGRPFIGRQWTHTKPVTLADGSVSIEIYNRAETRTFQTKSNAPIRGDKSPSSRKTYPIAGDKLLNILLNGAKAHVIRARGMSSNLPKGSGGKPGNAALQFLAVKGQRASRFGGSLFDASGGVSVGRFSSNNLPDTEIRAQRVNHPGVTGSRFLQTTKSRLEAAVAAEGQQMGDRITARI